MPPRGLLSGTEYLCFDSAVGSGSLNAIVMVPNSVLRTPHNYKYAAHCTSRPLNPEQAIDQHACSGLPSSIQTKHTLAVPSSANAWGSEGVASCFSRRGCGAWIENGAVPHGIASRFRISDFHDNFVVADSTALCGLIIRAPSSSHQDSQLSSNTQEASCAEGRGLAGGRPAA
jgi:hypothetical protein